MENANPRASGVSRRGVLVGAGAVTGLGLVATPGPATSVGLAHQGAADLALPIWAATRRGNHYLGLGGSAEAPQLYELSVAGSGDVTLGTALDADLPEGFAGQALYAADDLLVAGEQAAADATRPAVLRVAGETVTELPVAGAVAAGYGAATGITAGSPRHLTVLVEGALAAEQAYNDVTWVARSADAGRTWRADRVAGDLGEGYPSHLATAGAETVVLTVDAAGTRRLYRDRFGQWSPGEAVDGTGPVLALVAHPDGTLDLYEETTTAVRRRRRGAADSAWRDAGELAGREPVQALVPVTGSNELIAIAESAAYLVSAG